MSTRTYYKDPVTEARRYTRGTFVEWIQGGTFGFWYAVFQRPNSDLLVPRWAIEANSRDRLPPLPPKKETQ